MTKAYFNIDYICEVPHFRISVVIVYINKILFDFILYMQRTRVHHSMLTLLYINNIKKKKYCNAFYLMVNAINHLVLYIVSVFITHCIT